MSKSEAHVFGLHAVQGLLDRHPERILELWVQQERHDARLQAVLEQAQRQGLRVQRAPRKTLDKLAAGGTHQGVVARAQGETDRVYAEADLDDLLDALRGDPFLLVLDGVQDPHNLGACLRTADAAGVHAVLAPKDRACGLSPAARKVACGAAESVPFIQVTNLARTLQHLKDRGIWLVGAAGEARASLFETSLRGPLALVLGAEEKGLRRLTRDTCDSLARLPMRGQVESLNVSVATGICLYEALRQRETPA